jgi:predicted TPR repeat methyltransferase
MSSLYTSGQYLANTGSWHAEDSAWKADYISVILERNRIACESYVEVGCGAGGILDALSGMPRFASTRLYGYDISPKAIELCEARQNPRIRFACQDVFADAHTDGVDVLAAIDVFEHVPDYMGFLERCQRKARYKIYHVPLEIHVSAVLRGKVDSGRYSVGHLHYFTAESAIATLRDTGHRIIDQNFTDLALLTKAGRGPARAAANLLRRMVSAVSPQQAARLLGGISLLVLTQ